MMNSETVGTGPINLGNPNEFTINQLAELVIDLSGSKSKIVHLPAAEDDPRQRQPIIDQAKQYLQWEPTIQLREGLQKTIDYFKSL
jgi:UDP-glucuronate decarboxylase